MRASALTVFYGSGGQWSSERGGGQRPPDRGGGGEVQIVGHAYPLLDNGQPSAVVLTT